jgi:hypothetical protein
VRLASCRAGASIILLRLRFAITMLRVLGHNSYTAIYTCLLDALTTFPSPKLTVVMWGTPELSSLTSISTYTWPESCTTSTPLSTTLFSTPIPTFSGPQISIGEYTDRPVLTWLQSMSLPHTPGTTFPDLLRGGASQFALDPPHSRGSQWPLATTFKGQTTV